MDAAKKGTSACRGWAGHDCRLWGMSGRSPCSRPSLSPVAASPALAQAIKFGSDGSIYFEPLQVAALSAFVSAICIAVVSAAALIRARRMAEEDRERLLRENADLKLAADRTEAALNADDQRTVIWGSRDEAPKVMGSLPEASGVPRSQVGFPCLRTMAGASLRPASRGPYPRLARRGRGFPRRSDDHQRRPHRGGRTGQRLAVLHPFPKSHARTAAICRARRALRTPADACRDLRGPDRQGADAGLDARQGRAGSSGSMPPMRAPSKSPARRRRWPSAPNSSIPPPARRSRTADRRLPCSKSACRSWWAEPAGCSTSSTSRRLPAAPASPPTCPSWSRRRWNCAGPSKATPARSTSWPPPSPSSAPTSGSSSTTPPIVRCSTSTPPSSNPARTMPPCSTSCAFPASCPSRPTSEPGSASSSRPTRRWRLAKAGGTCPRARRCASSPTRIRRAASPMSTRTSPSRSSSRAATTP